MNFVKLSTQPTRCFGSLCKMIHYNMVSDIRWFKEELKSVVAKQKHINHIELEMCQKDMDALPEKLITNC